jgi:hypothetical protein
MLRANDYTRFGPIWFYALDPSIEYTLSTVKPPEGRPTRKDLYDGKFR